MKKGVVISFLMLCISSCGRPAGPEKAKERTPSKPARPRLSLDRLFEDPPIDGVRIQGVEWTEDGSMVGYLRPSQENRDVLELWAYDVVKGESRRLVTAEQVVGGRTELTDEQIQELERKRITERGITSFVWSPDGKSILLPLGEELWIYELGAEARKLEAAAPLDPRFSPDGRKVSYVSGGEIWVQPVEGGTPRKLTRGSSDTIHNGVAEFVAQEEMGRYRGYWWSPDSSRIAFLQVDESGVDVWKRASYRAGESWVSEQRYPAAGRPNARVRPGLVDLATGWTYWVELDESVEYVARVDWSKDGHTLLLQVQPRNQKALRVLRVNPATAKASPFFEETGTTFVNLHDDLRFLEDGSFLWSTEQGGTRQLFHYSEDGKPMLQLTRTELPVVELEGVDEDAGRVLFTAVTNGSLEKHLFAASLDGGQAVQITSRPGWHDVTVSTDGRYFVDVHSSRTSPPRATIHDAGGDELAVLEDNPTPDLGPYLGGAQEFLEITAADGATTLHASMTKPPDFDPGQEYPVLIYGYGGPHGHVVADRWHRSIPWNQFLASRGFIVFSVDPRGSDYRGKAFEDEIFERFGVVEVVDHRAAVEFLRTLPYVDAARVGIWGWSYGGTLVLMSLMETEGFYRCGIAVAPVTDWHWYDTHYTERYLGMPEKNAGIYAAASPVEKDASQIEEKLLLVHGMADDNVFLQHSLAFMERLQDGGTQFDLMLYPGKTHLIAGKSTRKHLYHRMFDFLEENLKAGE
jgi:dipeptidyl-peptidase-4